MKNVKNVNVHEMAKKEAEAKNWNMIASKPISQNPLDWYLFITLCSNQKGEYVTHLYNVDRGGFHNGHYYNNDEFQNAMNDFSERN